MSRREFCLSDAVIAITADACAACQTRSMSDTTSIPETVEIFRAFVTLMDTPYGRHAQALDVLAEAARDGRLPAALEVIVQG